MTLISYIDIESEYNTLLETFKSGITRPLLWRKDELRKIEELVREGESYMIEAFNKDIGAPAGEVEIMQVHGVLGHIGETIRNLVSWNQKSEITKSPSTFHGSSYTQCYPRGVVLLSICWNVPFFLAFVGLAGAIAAGNCVMIHLPDNCPTSSLLIKNLIEKYLTNSAVKCNVGSIQTLRELLSYKWDLVLATGSKPKGDLVYEMASKNMTPVILELGGKSPVLVEDISMRRMKVAAQRIGWAAFTNAGQICVRPDYILVDELIGDDFVRLLRETVQSLYLHETPKKATLYAPTYSTAYLNGIRKNPKIAGIINKESMKRLLNLIEDVSDLCGMDLIKFIESQIEGDKENGDDEKVMLIFPPLIVDFGTDIERFKSSRLMQVEIFGPIIPVCRYSKDKDPLEIIEKFSYRREPLSAYLFTSSNKSRDKFINNVTAGTVVINDCLMQMANPNLPFGGVGSSGIGRYFGEKGFRALSNEKSVMIFGFAPEFDFRYPPMTEKKRGMWLLLNRASTSYIIRGILAVHGLLRLDTLLVALIVFLVTYFLSRKCP